MAKIFSCQRPRTLAVVYVIPSSPDRRYQKTAIKDLFILLIKLLIRQNVCQRQPQCFRSVLSLQNAPSDCQGNLLSRECSPISGSPRRGRRSPDSAWPLRAGRVFNALSALWSWKEIPFKAEFWCGEMGNAHWGWLLQAFNLKMLFVFFRWRAKEME